MYRSSPYGQGANGAMGSGAMGGARPQYGFGMQQQQAQPRPAMSLADQMRNMLQQKQQQMQAQRQQQGSMPGNVPAMMQQQQQQQQQPQRPQAPFIPFPNAILPPPETPEEKEAREKQEAQEEARAKAEELRQQVERNEGYLECSLGQVIHGAEVEKYTVIDKQALGVGVFSVVYQCADASNKLIALKIVRHQDHFRKYANKEVAILQRVRELATEDTEGAAHVAMLRDSFVHKVSSPKGDLEYLCMAFERLEQNLRSVGRQELDKVLSFSKQIMLSLRFLHEKAGIVHCDVKPDNLLLRWDGLAVKLCDFGTARTSPEIQTVDELQPLFYRAPEVFIGAPRGRKIDVWSAALTIYELVVGRILFRNCHTPREVLEMSMDLRGPVPSEIRQQGRLSAAYFSSKGFHREVGTTVDPEAHFKKKPLYSELAPFADYGKQDKAMTAQEQAKAQLSRLIGSATVVSGAMKRSGGATEGEKKLKQLADLLDRCMDISSATRCTAAEACEHDVFKAVELPPMVELKEAPPLPEEAPPPLPPTEAPPPPAPA
eukprot:TRINITY_DN10891_c0_g1_i5.p1 TRINITY_DN10891_c0_g1~~TRINITY_DN10891_c0_g1_i5.p1  ORF type:complete len:607 (-),score=148.18 TRINITY_DN10891_c0_g1_i5:202-1836(-)